MKNTILLVDDEEGIINVLNISLADIGYQVYTAKSGEEALRIFRKINPPVVLTDIKMPGMDGIELLRQIKLESPETEVIMVTGHGNLELAIKSLKHDASDYITKPINHDVLEIALKRAFDKIVLREKLKASDKSSAMYDVLINQLIQEYVMIIGADYRIIDINDNLLKKLGLTKKDAVGQFCYKIAHKQSVPCSDKNHQCPLRKTLETKKPSQETHIHKGKNNKDIYYSISIYPLFENGEVIGTVELSRDITNDINVQKALMKQDKLVSIGRLSAGVAHEINNPLTTILTTSMLIQEDFDPDNPTYKELQTITDETLRCRKIVASLLDFARQTKPAKNFSKINDIAIECLQLTKKQAAFNNIAVKQNLSENIPGIYMDKDQIQQALINLILNAMEATNSGGRITITTVFEPQDEVIEIAVSDTGEGIDEDHVDKIFDPFFTTKESGTGLGLAITHGIIEQHGGHIDVKSKSGRGTTFTIRLPVNSGEKNDHR